jgi:alpha-L-rhamnosidase
MKPDPNRSKQWPLHIFSQKTAWASALLLLFLARTGMALTPTHLRTESLQHPQGLDVSHPRLSWLFIANGRGQEQVAYQIQIANSAEQAESGRSAIWDTGKVVSSQNFGIVYAGPDLRSGGRYYWKLRVWGQDGKASGWSRATWWQMGLLHPSDWQGSWIGSSSDATCPLLRREFQVTKKIKQATAYVFGFGWYELHLNGTKVGDNVLAPVNSNYGKNLYYDTFDVTSLIQQGGNAAGLWLGNGYDREFSEYGFRWMSAKQAILEVDIEFIDGSRSRVLTDGSWKTAESPILSNSIYHGETYDARRDKDGWDRYGYDDHAWQAAQLVPAPAGVLRARQMPPLKIRGTLRPRAMHRTKAGTFVFDLGQNIAGWMRLRARGVAGTTIVMRHAEDLLPDGTLDITTNQAARATDTFILKGAGVEVYEPRFTYHGFRYVELSGFPGIPTLDSLAGRVIHAAFDSAGTFRSSNPLLNKIHRNLQWGVVNNLMGIPTDNPVRNERTPCQMDSMAVEETAMYNFDMDNYYVKWLQDIEGGRDAPNWSGDQVFLPMLLYKHYGDLRILEESYENSKQLIDAFAAQASEPHTWSGGGAFGDWCPPGQGGSYKECFSEGEIVNTTIYYRATRLVSEMAEILGKTSDALAYKKQAESILREFNAHYYNASSHTYESGRQVTSVLPLAFGMVPHDQESAVANALLDRLTGKDRGHLDTGIFGTRYLFDVLIDNGFSDAAYKTLNQTTYPSYGHQISLGATTTWEQWAPRGAMETHDHAMFAGPDSTFYSRLAGIQAAQPGYKEILIRPAFPKGLVSVTSSLHTVMGEIVSSWKVQNGLIQEVTIPPNATAVVYVPAIDAAQIREGGRPARQAKGVHLLRMENGFALFSVGSGSYRFTVPAKKFQEVQRTYGVRMNRSNQAASF